MVIPSICSFRAVCPVSGDLAESGCSVCRPLSAGTGTGSTGGSAHSGVV